MLSGMTWQPLSPAGVVREFTRARTRVHTIMDEVTDATLERQWMPILSPMVWDLAHIGHYEDLWLGRSMLGSRLSGEREDRLYDAFLNPRSDRMSHPLLGPVEARRYIGAIRDRSLAAIEAGFLDPARADDPAMVNEGFVVGLIIQHEHQHAETVLQSRQAMEEAAEPLHHAAAGDRPGARIRPSADGWCRHPGGEVTIGTSDNPWAYDNERPAHTVRVAPFRIAAHPVTCGEWAEFIRSGGYDDRGLWTPEGWEWRHGDGVDAPLHWRRASGDDWRVLRFGRWRDVDPDEPVQHVSWFEADAFARFVGARLPDEIEWEAAVAGTPRPRWPDANAGSVCDGPRPVTGSSARSAIGCRDMLGGVWEWTAGTFVPWPGFRVFPYAEYSEVFFGHRYRVLRGGSWATDPMVCRTTFRNWDLPQRRQLFAGLRLARDDT